MEAEVKGGEVQEPIVDEKPAFGPDDVKRMIEEAVGETNKAWQSRFDKVLTEKKQTESKALTVEERMAQLERERQTERITGAREIARTKYEIDSDLEQAILDYNSDDPETIKASAQRIKELFTKGFEDYKKSVEEELKKKMYGSKSPLGGGGVAPTEIQALEKRYTEYAQQGNQVKAMETMLLIREAKQKES